MNRRDCMKTVAAVAIGSGAAFFSPIRCQLEFTWLSDPPSSEEEIERAIDWATIEVERRAEIMGWRNHLHIGIEDVTGDDDDCPRYGMILLRRDV